MSFDKRIKAARKHYKQAKSSGSRRLPEGEYQIKIVKPKLAMPKSGGLKDCLTIEMGMEVAVGPHKGAKPNRKLYTILDADNKPGQGLEFFKSDLDSLGVDPDFDFNDIKKILKSLDGMIAECAVRDNTKDPRFQNVWINGPVDSLEEDDEDEEEDEEEEEEEEEEVEEDEEEEEEEEEEEDEDEEEDEEEEASMEVGMEVEFVYRKKDYTGTITELDDDTLRATIEDGDGKERDIPYEKITILEYEEEEEEEKPKKKSKKKDKAKSKKSKSKKKKDEDEEEEPWDEDEDEEDDDWDE